ncbi:MAG: acyltransferase [Acidimicrobiia bacterium]
MEILNKVTNHFPIERKGSLEEALKEKKNNLNVIRLGAALLVIVDHAFPLAGRPHWLAARFGFTLGTIAVSTFFFLSGLLIARSWNDDPNIKSFVLKRILRIFPGYWVAILFCAYVVGPMVTTISLSEYFSSRATLSYAVHNALLFPIRYTLPGVFENNVYPQAVNGSIWTLPLEFFAYGCVIAIGLIGVLKYRKFSLLLLGGLAYINFHLVPDGKLVPPSFLLMSTIQLWALLLPFCLGVVCFCYKDKIKLDANFASVALAAFLLSLGTPFVDFTRVFFYGAMYC